MPTRSPLIIARKPLLKPAQGARLDYAHPLARGLLSYFLLNEGAGKTVRDLAKRSRTSTLDSTASWVTTPYGVAVKSGTNAASTNTLSSSITTSGASWSVGGLFRHRASDTYGGILEATADGYGVVISSNVIGVDGTGIALGNTTLTVGQYYAFVVAWTGAASSNYLNGRGDGGNTNSGVGNPSVFANWGGNGVTGLLADDIVWFGVWDRVLAARDALALYQDPWALLVSPVEQARSFAILGGSTSSAGVAIAGEADGTGAGTGLTLTVSHSLTLEADGTGAGTALTLTVSHPLTLEADGVGTGTTLSLTVSHALSLEADGTGSATSLTLTVSHPLALESDGTGAGVALTLSVSHPLVLEADGSGSLTTLTLSTQAGAAIQGTASGTGVATGLTLTVSHAIAGEADGSGAGVALTLTVARGIVGQASGRGLLTTIALTTAGAQTLIGFATLAASVPGAAALGARYATASESAKASGGASEGAKSGGASEGAKSGNTTLGGA